MDNNCKKADNVCHNELRSFFFFCKSMNYFFVLISVFKNDLLKQLISVEEKTHFIQYILTILKKNT